MTAMNINIQEDFKAFAGFSASHSTNAAIFDYYAPHKTSSKAWKGLLSIPHSGEHIPEEFKEFLSGDERAYKEDVDYKVSELIDIEALNEAGIGVMIAHIHRVAVDLNRPQDKALLHWIENTKGVKMVMKTPENSLVEKMQGLYYYPYLDLLKTLIQELEQVHPDKKVSFIDLHSMPSAPTAHHLKTNPNQATSRADFCLSDLKGLSCDKAYIEFIKKSLEDKGWAPKINDPYFGGYVTQYAHTFRTNAVQIEINRKNYMDEKAKTLFPLKAQKMKEDLTSMLLNLYSRF